MAERPLYTLYKNLKAQNYDVPDDYNKFESALTREGKGGADNRHAIYENLKAQNFDVPSTYERFYSALFEPRSKTSSRAKGGSVPMTAADRARFSAGAAAISASAQHTMNNAGRYNRLKQRKQKQQKDFGRVNLGTHQTPYGGDANNVVKDDFAYNPETGKAGAYVTSDNENAYTQNDAEQKQNLLDKYGEEWNNAVGMGIVPSELDMADPDLSDTDISMRQMERRQEWLNKNQDRRSKELNESMHLQGSPFVASGGAVAPSSFNTAISNEANRLSDVEYGAYNTAKAYNQMLRTTLLQELKEQKQRNENAGWWKDKWNDVSNYFGAMFNTMLDPKLYSQGVMDAAISNNLLQVKKGMEDGTIKKGSNAGNAAQAMLGAIQQQQGEAAKQQQYGTKAYQYGDMSGRSLKFMADFASSGWRNVMTTGFTKAGEKVGEKMALGALGKWFTKNTGRVLGDMAGSAALAATNQLGSTYNNVIERYVGMNNENGGVTQDKNGDLKFNEGVSLGKAIKDGFGSATIENFSEMFGEYLPGAPKLLSKLGLSKVSAFFEKIGNNAYYKWLSNATNKSGIQGVMAEISEEEFGTALHAAWGDGDGSWSDFNVFTNPDAREKQIDTCLGMFYSVGFMQAPRTAVGAINAVQYFNIKHQVAKADKFGQVMFNDKWDEIKSKIDVTTNADLTKTVLDATRSDSMTAKQKGAVINYAMFLSKLRGFNQAADAKTKDKVEEGDTAPTLSNDLDDAYTEGHNADDTDKHNIQLEQNDKANELAAMLHITPEQLHDMTDEDLETMTGQNDKLDQAIYDYQVSTAKYQGVMDGAQDEVDMAAHQAAMETDNMTDLSRGTVRKATIKATGGLEDYEVYIISGNIATHDDGSIDVGNSDDMIIYYDPTTGRKEHADAMMFADLIEELPAADVKAQAINDAKENVIKKVAGIIDGTVEVGSQFSVTDADGTEHTYEVLADNGDGTAMITIDGNVPTELVKGENVQIPYSFADLQQMKDLEDQKRLEAAKAQREQMEKERAAQQNQETEETQPSFDFNQILNDDGNVVLVDVLDKDGNTKYPDSRLFLIRDTGAKAKVVELKSDGTIVPHAVNKEDVATISSMSLDEYKQAMPESSMIEDNSGEESDEDSQLANLGLPKGSEIWMSGDGFGRPKESTLSRVVGIDEQGSIVLEDKDGKKWSASFDYINNHRELPPLDENANIINEENNQSESNADENTPAPEQTPAITLEDGTIVPMLEDGNPDFSKLTAAQTAELYDSQFGEDADSIVSGYVSDAKKALDKANSMTVKGKTFVEQKAAKQAKEKAIADAQAAYDSAIAIRDAYNERQLAKVEDTADGRKELIEKARRKFARLKSAVKDDAEAVSQLYRDTIGSLLHRLYDSTGIDVTDTTPLTAEEYVASNLGAHSLNYEGTETSKGVKQETGLSREDFAKTQLLAADGKGTTIDSLVHSLWENRPSNLESLDTQDIRNALIGVLNSGFKASEARNFVENIRIAQAENILEEQKRAQENAAYAEQHKAEPEAELKAKSDEKAELKAKSEAKLDNESSNESNDLSNESDNEKTNDKINDNINVPEDATDEAPLGAQRDESDLPFSAKENSKQQTTAERAADVEKNKVDDMKVVDNIVGQKTRKAFERLAKMMGANIQWQYSDKLGNGWIQETTDADGNVHRTIFVTLDSSITEGAQFIFGHEMTHQIKNLNPAAYNELTQLVLDTYGSDAFDKAVDETMKRYSDAGFSGRARDYYAEEVVADSVGEMIRDLNLAHTLAMKMSHPLLAAIHEILQKIKLAFFGTEYSDVTKNIIRSIEQAYVKTAKGEVTNSETGEDVSFSLRLKSAIEETETNPSDAQKESGNYKKGHIKFGGYDYTIENPKGSTRSGKDADGKEWKVTMHDTYGYIRGKFGKDGDHLDMFINDKADLDNWNGDVFVVDQVNPDGSFDEHKVMYGYDSMDDAKKAYLANYSDGWKGLGNITGVSKDEFDKWLDTSNRKLKPFADYAKVKFSLKDIKPVGVGAFGNIYNQFRGNAKAAIEFLKKVRGGEAVGALHHKDIGDIDLVWGKEGTGHSDGYGLSKLVKYHPEVLDNLQEILNDMRVVSSSKNRVNLESETHKAGVRLTWDGERKSWLLTAFKKETSASDKRTDTAATSLEGDTALSQTEGSAAKIDNSSETAKENGEKFSLKDEKTLAGVHNISEEKLLKAIKQGGLANPSVAVIDSSRQDHKAYGGISLILPSDKIAKRTGKNAGTWQGDAYTPTYPEVEKQMSNKGAEKSSSDVLSVPKEMQHEVRNGIDRWLNGGDANSGLKYLFLHEKGVAPEPKMIQPKFSDEAYNELKFITAGDFNIYGIGKADAQKVLDMYIEAKFDGDKDLYEEKTKAWLERNKSIVDAGAKGGMRYAIAKENVELYDEYGFNYKGVQTFVRDVEYDHRKSGVDTNATLNEVEDYIKTNNLTDEFNTWLEGKEKEYGIKEVIFDGFTPSGNRRYVPNTLENVSKLMKKQGRNGATGAAVSFQNFAARLMPFYGTLKDIRSKKGLLTSDREKFDKFREKWSNVFFELGMKCQPDATGTFDDYGLARLSEAAMTSDPQAYLKKEYNVDFSDEDTKRLKEMVKAIKEEHPAMYFETKFERPVRFDEFSAAVVPTTTKKEVKEALKNAGVSIFEYDEKSDADRKRAFNEAINSSDNIRFSLAGERGAAAADKAEERTFRMDNLSVAKDMEKNKKKAKAIKAATGWERGADGKWRYEMPDVVLRDPKEWVNKKTLTLSDIVEKPNDLFKEYPELFDAYPELKDMKILKGRAKSGGVFYNNAITLNLGDIREAIKYDMDTHYKLANNSLKKTLVHEIQHYIQDKEGFAQGGNNEMIIDKNALDAIAKLRAEKDAVAKEFYAMSPEEQQRRKYEINKRYNDLTKQIERLEKSSRIGYDGYNRLSGEVEARNVSSRLNMTPEERRKTLAESTEDVARKDQIFLGVGDVSFSLRDMADGKESGAADMAEDLKSLNTPDEVDDAIKTAIDDMPSGWQMANKKMIHIAQALGENRKAEIAGEEPKFSLKDGSLIKAGTYFSGGGLVEEGLKGIIDPVVAVEYDEKISGVYRNNFGQHIVTADVRDVDPKELVKQIDGEVEYFHASPVCKNYSQAKSNHAEVELDKETAASTAEFINAVKPKVVTIENVKGYKDSDAMKTITDALDANGYTWDADVYNAADYGGYTNRERLIVRAVRDGKLPAKPKKMAHKSGWYEVVADIIPTLTEKKNGVAPWMDIRLKADGIDWRNIDKPLYVMGSAYADGKVPHAFADELLPTLRTKSGDVIVMPDGKVYRAMGRVLARVSGVSDDYKMPFSENLSHTIIGNGIPTQLTEHVIAPLLTGSDPKFSIRTYHGTGVNFDKFDLSHAFEGEGSETFGHGVYVTNSKKIGDNYAQRAKDRKGKFGFDYKIDMSAEAGQMLSHYINKNQDVDKGLENARQDLKSALEMFPDDETLKELSAILQKNNNEIAESSNEAYRYDVDIPDDNGENYLGWNESQNFPLEKWYRLWEITHHGFNENEYFKDGGARYDKDRIERIIQMKLDSPENGMQKLPTLKGEELYHALEDFFDRERPLRGAKLASRALSEIGFVGIKYPAGLIHGGAEEADYNYVIFDENNANIVGNTRFSLRYDQFEHDLNQWKKDNNLPKDAQRPTIPQRNAGESAVDFLRRVDEYRKQMALWKTAPTYEQHLLSDDTALGEFNRELQRGSVLKRIAFQDSMLAIRKAQEAIMKEVGVDRLNMAEDAYTAENRSHGKGKNEFEEYNNEFLQPLRKAYHQMKKILGDSYDNVRIYMMAKHGLERDAQMAFKKSLEADYEDVAQRSAAYKAYKGDMNRIINDSDLEFGRVDFTTWRQRDNALRVKYSPSYMDYRYDKNGIVYDYSGLSALFDGSDFEEAAHKLVKDIESKYVAETHNLWDATNAATKKVLRDGYKAGMMSKDTYQYVRDMYSHYIPLRGWDGTTADQVWDYIGGGKGAFNQTLKKAHGRTSIADDPIAYIENMAESGILLNNKNWVKQHLMLLAQNHPTSLLTLSKAWYVKSVDDNGNEEWIPATLQITSQMDSNQVKAAIDAFEKKMEKMAQTGDATQKRDGLNIAYPQTHSEEREHEVRVMKDGDEYVIYVNGDPQLAQAMNNTRAHRVREIQSGKLDRAAAWLGRKMAAAYTSLSPLFIPSNYFRDLTMTLASTAIREDAKYNYLLRKNLATSWNLGFMLRDYQSGKLREKVSNGNATSKEQMFYDFMMNGGETGFVSSLDVEDLKKKFKNDLKDLDRWKTNPVKVGHTIMDGIEFLNRAIEDSNRFAVYMTSIQYGRSIDEAVNDAKDVTLNFNRKGTGEYGWQMIRNLYLFINPAVQSLQTLGALAKHHPFKFTAVTASWLVSGVLVPIVNAALMSLLGGDDDKDKYWQFTKWDRRNNLIMWVPFTHEYVKIPLAQEFRAFYGIGDMIASKMMGGELAEESWSQYAEDLLGQVVDMLPLDPTGYDGNIAVSLMPNAIRPVFELAFNVDFTGKPLFKETEYNKYDPNFTKAYVGTPDWLVRASKMVNSIGNDYPDVQQNSIDAFGDPRYNLNNPAVVDHVLSSYLGGAYTMGSQVLGLLTKSLNDRKEIKVADIPLVSKFVSNPDDRPVSKKQGDEFWDKKEYYDRASNTISKLKKQAKIDGDYSLLERFYGSEEYKTYKLYEKDVKDYKEARKKERAEESGDEYRPHQLNAEDIYNNHATPMDEFEDMKLKQLFEKLNSFKTRYDAIVDNAPNESDSYYNTNKAAIDAIDEISLDKQEISELKKGFLDDGKDAYNAEDMKQIRDLRKKILAVLEKANKVVVANQKAKAEK
jgi:site-specific DNA-cytosine methylase